MDTLSGLGLEVIVQKKGYCLTAETELIKFLIEIGRSSCTLLGDNEPSLINLMQRVVKKLGTSATYRTTANYSPASKGNVERRHSTVLGQSKTLSDDLCSRFGLKELSIMHPLFQWLVKHSCFLVNRYLVHADNLTSYSRRWSKEYNSPLCIFAETVMYKVSQPLPNSEIGWGTGTYLGRCTINNEIFVGTSTGEVVRVRTIKRLTTDQQANKTVLLALKGTPLHPSGTGPLAVENTALILQPAVLTQFQFTNGSNKRQRQTDDTATDVTPTDTTATQPTTDDFPSTEDLSMDVDDVLNSHTLDSNYTGTSSSSTAGQQATAAEDMEIDTTADTSNSSSRTRPLTESTATEPSTSKRLRRITTSINLVGTTKDILVKDKRTRVLLNEEVIDTATYLDDENQYLDPTLVVEGINNEAESLDTFDVYDKVPLASATTKVLSTRWVHKLKEILVKSRLVVRGFEQLWTDAFTASPTPSLTTLLTLLTLAISTNMQVNTGDVSTAFLHANLTEDICASTT